MCIEGRCGGAGSGDCADFIVDAGTASPGHSQPKVDSDRGVLKYYDGLWACMLPGPKAWPGDIIYWVPETELMEDKS